MRTWVSNSTGTGAPWKAGGCWIRRLTCDPVQKLSSCCAFTFSVVWSIHLITSHHHWGRLMGSLAIARPELVSMCCSFQNWSKNLVWGRYYTPCLELPPNTKPIIYPLIVQLLLQWQILYDFLLLHYYPVLFLWGLPAQPPHFYHPHSSHSCVLYVSPWPLPPIIEQFACFELDINNWNESNLLI